MVLSACVRSPLQNWLAFPTGFIDSEPEYVLIGIMSILINSKTCVFNKLFIILLQNVMS